MMHGDWWDFQRALEAVVRGDTSERRADTVADKMLSEAQDGANADLFETATQETEDYLLRAWQGKGVAFEHIVAAVLRAVGYTATVTSASRDHGVDVIAHPDPLGLEQPYVKVQAKSGASTIGEPLVSQLIGSLHDREKGIFISLGGFSNDARSKARNAGKVSLIDAKQFVSLFLDHYEKLDPIWQAKYPLARVYVPRG